MGGDLAQPIDRFCPVHCAFDGDAGWCIHTLLVFDGPLLWRTFGWPTQRLTAKSNVVGLETATAATGAVGVVCEGFDWVVTIPLLHPAIPLATCEATVPIQMKCPHFETGGYCISCRQMNRWSRCPVFGVTSKLPISVVRIVNPVAKLGPFHES